MKEDKREYLGILCKLYMIVLLAALPLYMPDGFYFLGDMKYRLFRNGTIVCMGIWLLMEGYCFLCGLYDKAKQRSRSAKSGVTAERGKTAFVDIFVLAYGGCVLLSAICSSYDAAWEGYQDWYMGAITQLLFVGIYFFVSRYYSYDRLTIFAGEAAFGVIVLIGLLNRLELDPLRVFVDFAENAWESGNLLSTIGNINWFCGYCSVMLSLPLSGYLYSQKKGKSVLLYLVSVLGLTILCIQGSDSGPVLAAVAIGCCLLAGRKKKVFFQKGLWLFVGMMLGIWMMGHLINITDAWNAIPVDSWIYHKLLWNGWLVLALIGGVCLFCLYKLQRRVSDKALQKGIQIMIGVMILTVATIAVFVMVNWSKQDADAWGSGRGMLWRLAWEGYLEADVAGKLIGAGPDCFAEYLISIGKTPIITQEDHWANALFVNAHNEWLNHLVNLGVLGVISYAGIFVAAWKRYKGMMLAALMLAMYGVHSLVSFQQVLNTPLFFAVLGLCEATYRRKTRVNNLTQV